jgi:hypothetical protein
MQRRFLRKSWSLRAEPKLAGGLLAALLVVLAHDAGAYCFATTCNPKDEHCATVNCAQAPCCVIEGQPLHWATECLSFGVQQDGSPLRHISYQTADQIIQHAFLQWTGAACGGNAHPSIRMWDLGGKDGIVCDVPEFNETRPNANVWMFRDTDWPYEDPDTTLAFTSTIYDKTTGALLDADVEINSKFQNLTTTDNPLYVDKDLGSIVTHEAGHFLGLAHSEVDGATMNKGYKASDTDYRSLQADDIAAICNLYPPERNVPACTQPSPPHGFSRYCGNDAGTNAGVSCSVAPGRRALGFFSLTTAGALGLAFLSRRRRRKS